MITQSSDIARYSESLTEQSSRSVDSFASVANMLLGIADLEQTKEKSPDVAGFGVKRENANNFSDNLKAIA